MSAITLKEPPKRRIKKGTIKRIISHIIVLGIGIVMIYPLIWMFMSSFKETGTIFQTAGEILPFTFSFREGFTILWIPTWENFVNGWRGVSNVTFGTFFTNSAILAVGGTFGAVISSALVGYAFSRGRFAGRKILFALMLSTLMLPAQVLMVPQFLWFHRLGWIGSYMPLIVPAFFAISGFFVYLITNFMDGIPRELDEAAKIDGCSFYGIFIRIILPLSVPALITTSLFSFIWRWDDFMGPLIYVRGTANFPASLALRMFADPAAATDWGAVFAMSTLSLVPAVMIFIFLQKYLVEGIATSGLKG